MPLPKTPPRPGVVAAGPQTKRVCRPGPCTNAFAHGDDRGTFGAPLDPIEQRETSAPPLHTPSTNRPPVGCRYVNTQWTKTKMSPGVVVGDSLILLALSQAIYSNSATMKNLSHPSFPAPIRPAETACLTTLDVAAALEEEGA